MKPESTEHLSTNNKISQFTKLQFKDQDTADKFMTEWRQKAKPKNGGGHPIFAKPDVPAEVRKLRRPMVEAEKLLKDYYKSVQQNKAVRTKFQKHAIMVDGVKVAHRNRNCAVIWDDMTLEANIQTFRTTG
jgi:hypothetical protein